MRLNPRVHCGQALHEVQYLSEQRAGAKHGQVKRSCGVFFDFTQWLLQVLFEPIAFFFGDELLHCVQFNGPR